MMIKLYILNLYLSNLGGTVFLCPLESTMAYERKQATGDQAETRHKFGRDGWTTWFSRLSPGVGASDWVLVSGN